MKLHFTKAAIANLPVGTHGDTKVQGLVVKVTESSRRYGVYVSIKGIPTRKAIGLVEDWSVEAARSEAQTIISGMRRETPESRREKEDKATTVRILLADFTKSLIRRGKKHVGYMDKTTHLYWPHLLDRRLGDIGTTELQRHHDKLSTTRGPSAARYAVNTLRILLNFAISQRVLIHNPTSGVERADATTRDVFLEEDEIDTLRKCLSEMAPNPRHYFLLALLTGARRENLATMEWKEIDLDDAVWVIPAEKVKNTRGKAKAIEIPLVPEAVEILQGRQSLDARYVFPSSTKIGSPVRGIDDWMNDLRRRMRERGVDKHFTVHDLRRTFATRLAANGCSLPVIAQALGHRGLSCVGIYARASTETVRSALARVAQ